MKMMILGLFLLLITDWIGARSVDNLSLSATADTDCEESDKEVQIYLSVSSLAWSNGTAVTKRQIELNWEAKNPKYKDMVALYGSLPDAHTNPIEIVYVAEHPAGYYRTKYELPTYIFTKENITYGCLNFYVAYISENKITHLKCLETRPRWINDIRKYVYNTTLTELMIPGTHDSGSYSSFPYNDDGIFAVIAEFIYAQEESIFNQLVYGIRYLDLRVEKHNHEFIIKHGIFPTGNTLERVLSDVRDFVEATKEIVILDFHKHPSEFTEKELVRFLIRKLDPYIIPKGSKLTVGEILDSPYRILISFNQAKIANEEIWPSVCQLWANVRNVQKLKDYFTVFYNKSNVPPFLWSSMVELTPDYSFILEHSDEGLRKLADFVNRNATQWFRDMWGRFSNIVATDYFLGNDIISLAIDINMRRNCESRKPPAEDLSTFSCSPE